MSHSVRKNRTPGANAPDSKGQPASGSNARTGGPLSISAIKDKITARVIQDPAKAAKILSLWINSSAKSKK